MANHKRLDLLHHPLAASLLRHKWQTMRYSQWLDTFLYSCFLACLTLFIVDIGPLRPGEIDSSTGCRNLSSTIPRQILPQSRLVGEKSAIVAFLAFRIILEFMKLYHRRLDYFTTIDVYFYNILYATTFAFMWPPDAEPCFWNWVCGIVATLLAWLLILFHLEHLPITGIYSIMFQKVLLSLLKVLHVFSFFILGFALAFHISMSESNSFSRFHSAILKTFDMTAGELDYLSVFLSSDYGFFYIVVHSTFVMFVIFMPIALMNLLIGIAVGDIDGIRSGAEMKLLAIRVKLVYHQELGLPRFIQRRLYKSHRDVHPNVPCSRAQRFLNGSSEEEYNKYIAERQQQERTGQADIQKQLLMQQSEKLAKLEQTLTQVQEALKQLAAGSGHRAVMK